jgi:hypothetical protein
MHGNDRRKARNGHRGDATWPLRTTRCSINASRARST